MALASRIPVTVPAAGSFRKLDIRGAVVFVEESPENTPDGVPTVHLAQGGGGFPCYSRSAFAWLPGFRHLYVKGTAAAAGATLYLLVFDDPCGEGVYGSGAVISPNPCGDGVTIEDTEPTGTPTHALWVASTLLAVVDSTGSLVRQIVPSGTYGQIGDAFVHYGAEKIWFVGERDVGGSDHSILCVVNFDGTGLTELWDSTVPANVSQTFIDWDEGLGKLVMTVGSNVWTVNRDGSNPVLISTTAITKRNVAGMGHGAFLEGGSTSYRVVSYATNTALASVSTSSNAVEADLLTRKAFRVSGASSGTLERRDYDLTNAESIESDVVTQGLTIYGRWLYYITTGHVMRRVHLDDVTVKESLLSGLSAVAVYQPWWE